MTRFSSGRRWIGASTLALIAASIVATPAMAQQRDCNRPLRDPIMFFDVPGGEPAPTSDGCWVFTVFLDHRTPPEGSGVALLRRSESGFELQRAVSLSIPRLGGPTAPAPVGIALTHDDGLLVVSHSQRLTFIDVARMKSGTGNPVLGYIESPRLSRSWGVVVSADDKYAFAAQQGTASVVIVDLDKIRQSVFDDSALAGLIPTAQSATTPVLSRDGRYLYTTTLRPPDVVEAPLKCQTGRAPEGAVQIVDAMRARTEPGSATVGFAFPAGCNPVYATLSPDGNRLSVLAAGPIGQPAVQAVDSSLTVFDVRPVREGRAATLIAKMNVGPRPVRLVDNGDTLVVAFQYSGNPPETARVLFLDTSRIGAGKDAILGRLPFPSLAVALSRDGHTLFAANEGDSKFAVVDLQRVTLEPAGK